MGLHALRALIWKDLEIFFGDRRAVILSVAVPIAIASFFGSIFQGPGNDDEPAKIAVAIVDQDASAISTRIVAATQADRNLAVTMPSIEAARSQVQQGDLAVAVIIPRGFGEAAGRALFGQGEAPRVDLLFDPLRAAELGMVRGILTGHVTEAVAQQMFEGTQRRALTVHEQAVTGGDRSAYNGYAHSFAGMGIQFLLFVAIDLGMGILLERERGIWKRLRSAPLSRITLLGAKAASGTLLTLVTFLVSFGFAIVVFGVRIHGSVLGFLAVALSCSIMAAFFGLLVAAVGNTQAATRRVATFAVLIMVMLGGAWVPSFIFPAWLQRVTVVIPTRWAVDGLDAMTWRGLGLEAAVMPTLVLLAFAALFGVLTVWRFRWDEA